MKTRHTEGNPTEARAAAVCQRLQITRQDLARMTLAADLDAIEARLADAGEIDNNPATGSIPDDHAHS